MTLQHRAGLFSVLICDFAKTVHCFKQFLIVLNSSAKSMLCCVHGIYAYSACAGDRYLGKSLQQSEGPFWCTAM